jgi:hypothetical protein
MDVKFLTERRGSSSGRMKPDHRAVMRVLRPFKWNCIELTTYKRWWIQFSRGCLVSSCLSEDFHPVILRLGHEFDLGVRLLKVVNPQGNEDRTMGANLSWLGDRRPLN